MNSNVSPIIAAILVGMFIGGVSVYRIMLPAGEALTPPTALREEITDYRFIDPLLACNPPEATTGRYKELDNQLITLIDTIKEEGKASMVSLYFQEYPSGRWVGIDENHQYSPASLLKIVLMISYFKDDELHPGSLKNSYVYTAALDAINSSIPFDSTSTLTIGAKYSAEELVRSMIIDSDNGAKDILLENANQVTLNKVYKDLKIPAPNETQTYAISPRQYSLFSEFSTMLPILVALRPRKR